MRAIFERLADAWQYVVHGFGQLEIDEYTALWFIASFGLLFMTIWNASDGIKDKRALKKLGRNGDAKIALNLAIRTDIISAVLAVVTIVIGVAAVIVTSPEAFPDSWRAWTMAHFSTLFKSGLVALPTAMFIRTILNRLDRVKIVRRSH